jgi:hypothetical protein
LATLTNIQGFEIYFDPSKVYAVIDNSGSGNPTTTVYGVIKAPLVIAETAAAFLARVGIAAGFVELTRPDGHKVDLHAAGISVLRAVVPGEFTPDAKSVVFIGDQPQALFEDVAAAATAIRARGGKI